MIDIPDGVTVEVKGSTVKVKGPNGEVEKKLSPYLNISVKDKKVEIEGNKLSLINTAKAHIQNMIKGVTEGYKLNVKIVYSHFPVSVEIKGKDIIIKNFLGEKHPRKTEIIGNTKVEVKGQNISVTGPDKEAVGQTAANMRMATKINKWDPRIFQDGFYVIGE